MWLLQSCPGKGGTWLTEQACKALLSGPSAVDSSKSDFALLPPLPFHSDTNNFMVRSSVSKTDGSDTLQSPAWPRSSPPAHTSAHVWPQPKEGRQLAQMHRANQENSLGPAPSTVPLLHTPPTLYFQGWLLKNHTVVINCTNCTRNPRPVPLSCCGALHTLDKCVYH